MISKVCTYKGSADKGCTYQSKSTAGSKKGEWLESRLLWATLITSLIFPLADTPALWGFLPHVQFLPASFAWRCSEWLVFGLSQVWLKHCNRISPNHYTKDNLKKKKHIKEAHNTWVKTEGAESVAADTEDGGGRIKRVLWRVYTRERRAGPNPLLKNQRPTSQTHNWHSLSPSTGQVKSLTPVSL